MTWDDIRAFEGAAIAFASGADLVGWTRGDLIALYDQTYGPTLADPVDAVAAWKAGAWLRIDDDWASIDLPCSSDCSHS